VSLGFAAYISLPCVFLFFCRVNFFGVRIRENVPSAKPLLFVFPTVVVIYSLLCIVCGAYSPTPKLN
jgi:hypothetical protein